MTTTPVNAISRDLIRLEWVWRLLTPAERQFWQRFATNAGPDWHLHQLFFALKENGEK
jgi:hypothetical protein